MAKYIQSDMKVISPGQRIPIMFEVGEVYITKKTDQGNGIWTYTGCGSKLKGDKE